MYTWRGNGMKTHLKRFGICAAITLIFALIEFFGGEAIFNYWLQLIIFAALMYGLWIGFLGLKKRVRGHIYWIVPVATAAIFAIGLVITDHLPGWDGLGMLIMLLILLLNIACAFALFVIESIVTFVKRKKNGNL